ncbi:MAG: hypothetical protein K8S56_07695 [Candidatus Cloacimonetes bacterium]|nr:hypothetical protein [Candidatus Cloacimonadota bacterium]
MIFEIVIVIIVVVSILAIFHRISHARISNIDSKQQKNIPTQDNADKVEEKTDKTTYTQEDYGIFENEELNAILAKHYEFFADGFSNNLNRSTIYKILEVLLKPPVFGLTPQDIWEELEQLLPDTFFYRYYSCDETTEINPIPRIELPNHEILVIEKENGKTSSRSYTNNKMNFENLIKKKLITLHVLQDNEISTFMTTFKMTELKRQFPFKIRKKTDLIEKIIETESISTIRDKFDLDSVFWIEISTELSTLMANSAKVSELKLANISKMINTISMKLYSLRDFMQASTSSNQVTGKIVTLEECSCQYCNAIEGKKIRIVGLNDLPPFRKCTSGDYGCRCSIEYDTVYD